MEADFCRHVENLGPTEEAKANKNTLNGENHLLNRVVECQTMGETSWEGGGR